MKVTFQTVDVFTDRQFGGNPVAVIPDARGLSDAQMQALANEFNLAETTFVLPPDDPANTARVRIFTPRAEMPFAGHPNVGTAFVLAHLDVVAQFDHSEGVQALQLDPGIIRCEVPLSDGVGFVSLADPGVDLVDDCLFVGDAPVEALRGEDAEFGFGQVQPGTVFRRVMPFEALDECLASGAGKAS